MVGLGDGGGLLDRFRVLVARRFIWGEYRQAFFGLVARCYLQPIPFP